MRNIVSDLIIARSDRVTFHPLLIAPRDKISPALANNLEFVCVDTKPHRCLVVSKQCHTVFYNEAWNRPIIMKHLVRFHGIAQTDEKLKCRVRKTVQAPREALKQPAIMPNVSALTPTTPMEAAPSPSPIVKTSHRRKPSQESKQEVTLPQNTEASAPHTPTTLTSDELPLTTRMPTTITQETEVSTPHAPTTLDTDELPLTEKKPAAKKRSHRRKAGANDAPLKKRKQQKASMFEDKTNF